METMYIDTPDVEFVLSAIKRLHPGRKNSSTAYTNSRGEHCLVGQILAGLGVPVPDTSEGCNEANFRSTAVQSFYAAHGIEFSREAEYLIEDLQRQADFGVKYGEQPKWAEAITTATAA
jgi:hypothetical protein